MKILCFIDSLGSGGAQRQLVELAKGFQDYGYEVVFLVYHEENFFKPDLDRYKIPVKAILEKSYLKRFLKLRKAIRAENPDVVLSFLDSANFMATLSGFPHRKWKLIVSERSASPNIFRSFKLKFYRLFHLFANYVVANSTANLEIIKKVNPFLSDEKCKVIYNMVDEKIWHNNITDNYERKDVFNLVVFSSHQYLKNAKGMIEAVHLLSDEIKSKLKIDWYGIKSPDNSYDDAKLLIKKYNLHKNIEFFAPTDSVKDLMIASDCVGLFSYYEGLPNVVCEAMMLNRPVIASNISDLHLILQKDYIFNPYNPRDIAEVISNLTQLNSADLMKIGNRNLKVARVLFEKEKIINSYIKLFSA